jgi:hypothetical protein
MNVLGVPSGELRANVELGEVMAVRGVS